ncbi:MAG: hypothetical protein HKN23_04365, partial [Verrucomicrobiales bacterium]|nr:hypothetical protein [Verrucomicrobiales bacterium]
PPDDLDGVSLLPLFEGKTRTKPYIYCWYERNGDRKKASEHTRDQRFKLYKTGNFFDTVADRLEKNPIDLDKADGKTKTAHAVLKAALDKHLAVTKKADPVQTALKEKFSPPKKEKKPETDKDQKKKNKQAEKKKTA